MDSSDGNQAFANLPLAAILTKPVRSSALLRALSRAVGIGSFTCELEAPANVSTSAARSILVADDNAMNREIIAAMLDEHDLTFVEDGREAYEVFRNHEFDLVLMDVSMPEMDGIEATQAIRAYEVTRTEATPIIALTAHAMTGDRDRFLAAGMDDDLSKPIEMTALTEAVIRWGENRKGTGGCPELVLTSGRHDAEPEAGPSKPSTRRDGVRSSSWKGGS